MIRNYKIVLSEQSYQFIKSFDFSDIADDIRFDDNERSVTFSKYAAMLLIINKEIESRGVVRGQENLTEFGRKIIILFDEIQVSMEKSIPEEWKKPFIWKNSDGTTREIPFRMIHPFEQISISLSAGKDSNEHPPVQYDTAGNRIYGNHVVIDRNQLDKN